MCDALGAGIPAFPFVGLLKDKGREDEIERFGMLGCNYTPAREEQHKIFTGWLFFLMAVLNL